MRRAGEIRLPFDHDERAFREALSRLGIGPGDRWTILRKSLDARRKGRIRWVYAIGVDEGTGPPETAPPVLRAAPDPRPVVVGSGPAGLFAAYRLASLGVPPVLLEQGPPLAPRMRAIARFVRRGTLDPRANLCFGAGGAGTFSDGKLGTRVRSPHRRLVLETLVGLGAPEEILWLAAPHLGSNGIRRLIARLLARLESMGAEVRFGAQVDGLLTRDGRCAGVVLTGGRELAASHVVLATGHSARALYRSVARSGVAMVRKGFAVGARLEHPAPLVERIQYGDAAGHPALPPATYRLATTWGTEAGERALYSFCMCPRGFVLNAATESDGVVSNGMSNRPPRAGRSNAAFVVPVRDDDIPSDDPLHALEWQRAIETAAARAANPEGGCHALPAQTLPAFLDGRGDRELPASGALVPVCPARLDLLLPPFVVEAMRTGFDRLSRSVPGLVGSDGLLVGVETRTSSPVRIVRDRATFESVSLPGLYPVGEGAGYAGGIVSAAIDGIAAADALLATLPPAHCEL